MRELTYASPIPEAAMGLGASLELVDESCLTKLIVHVGDPTFEIAYGHSTQVGDVMVAATRPGERLLVGPDESVNRLVRPIIDEGATSVDVTHGRALLRLSGNRSSSLLTNVCDLDFSDRMTPDGAVASAYVARVVCEVIRLDRGDLPSFRLLFDRSYGPYVANVFRELLEKQSDGGK